MKHDNKSKMKLIVTKAKELCINYEDFMNVIKIRRLDLLELIPPVIYTFPIKFDGTHKYYIGLSLFNECNNFKSKNINKFIEYCGDAYFDNIFRNHETVGYLHEMYFSEDKKAVDRKRRNKENTNGQEELEKTTQIFTPLWIAKYLCQSSITTLCNEDYDCFDDNYSHSVRNTKKYGFNKDVSDIKILEPCCGGGIFLWEVLSTCFKIDSKLKSKKKARMLLENLEYGDVDEKVLNIADFVVLTWALKHNVTDFKPQGILYDNDFGYLDRKYYSDSKFDLIITNPPYAGTKNLSPELKKFMKKNYPLTKSADLFASCYERSLELLKQDGILSMITPISWMFLSSYEELRKEIYKSKSILSLLDFGKGAFSNVGVESCAFNILNRPEEVGGVYYRLVDDKNKQSAFWKTQRYSWGFREMKNPFLEN